MTKIIAEVVIQYPYGPQMYECETIKEILGIVESALESEEAGNIEILKADKEN